MWILQKKGLWIGAVVATCVGILHCILECIQVLPLQLVVAVCVVAYR